MSLKRARIHSRIPRRRAIRIGAPIKDVKAAVNTNYRITDGAPFTMEITPHEGHRFEAATVAHIRFRKCPYEIYIIICNAYARFGKWPYQTGEVIYYHSGYPKTIYREVFMIFADEVKIRPPHFDDPRLYSDGNYVRRTISAGEKIMYEPSCYGKLWVDLMWEKNIDTIDHIDEHFRNPQMSQLMEHAFKSSCEDFFMSCQLAMKGEFDYTP